jgi:cell division protein FtsL
MFVLQVKEEESYENDGTNNDTTKKDRKGSKNNNKVYITMAYKFTIFPVLVLTLFLCFYREIRKTMLRTTVIVKITMSKNGMQKLQAKGRIKGLATKIRKQNQQKTRI